MTSQDERERDDVEAGAPTPGLTERLADGLRFPLVDDEDFDRSKVEAVRIAVATILLWRLAWMLDSSRFYFAEPDGWMSLGAPESQRVLIQILLTIGVLVGLATPVCLAFLVVTTLSFDSALLASTLGSQVLLIVLATLLWCGAGTSWSADAALMRGRGGEIAARATRRMYSLLGDPPADQRRLYYLAALVAYGSLSIGGVAYHLGDSNWQRGETVRIMLANSYIARHYDLARALEEHAPVVMLLLSVVAGIGQTVFQLGLIPLVRWRFGRLFVIAWGFGFFGFSLLALQLSYLPYVEICLWVLVFWHRPRATEPVSPGIGQRELRARRGHTTRVLVAAWLAVSTLAVVAAPPVVRAFDRITRLDVEHRLATPLDRASSLTHELGLTPPNVFNQADLEMGDQWVVIDRFDAEGRRHRVELTGPDGERLDYHRSDTIYFGNALRWHRAMIDQDPLVANSEGTAGRELIEAVIRYDRRRSGEASADYVVVFHRSQASDTNVDVPDRFDATVVGEMIFASSDP